MAEPLSLIQTKLYRPPLQPNFVSRPRLIDRLNANWQVRPLTLISAPAGFGKSVLAIMWLEQCDCPTRWVSLDEGDNELRTFTGYFLAALKSALPDRLLETQVLLEAPSLSPPSRLARHLLADLAQVTTPFILVLDDIHRIHDLAIFEFPSHLLQHPPPGMHLVFIGRQDPPLPIGSLRAYQHITEIRLRDLRFSIAETATLLNRMLNRDVGDDLAATWTERTEGWAAALYLAGLSLRQGSATEEPGVSVRGDSSYLRDYLLVEVLGSLTAAEKAWLLRTSLLDRFCAPLVEVVCQDEREPNAEELLTGERFIRWLRQANLFLIDLDDQGKWFRFHHLFQENLQAQLHGQVSGKEIARMHRRASAWYGEHELIEPAIQHALAAGANAEAVDLLAQRRHRYMDEEKWSLLERCIGLIAEEHVADEPLLSMTKAFIAIARGKNLEIINARNQAERRITSQIDLELSKAVLGEIAVIDGVLSVVTGQAASALANGERALELLSAPCFHLRGLAIAAQIGGWQLSGDYHLQQACK